MITARMLDIAFTGRPRTAPLGRGQQATWYDRQDHAVRRHLRKTDERVQVRALADSLRVPPPRLRSLLFGYQRLLIELVRRELSMDEVDELLRSTP